MAGDGTGIGVRAVLIMAEFALDPSQHSPGLWIAGIGGELRLQKLGEIGELLIAIGRGCPAGQRLAGQAWAAEMQIEGNRQCRQGKQQQESRPGGALVYAWACGRNGGRGCRRQQTALDFQPRGCGFAFRQQAAGNIAVELAQLITIDRKIGVGAAAQAPMLHQRPGEQRDHRGRQQCGEDPEHHSGLVNRARRRFSSSLRGATGRGRRLRAAPAITAMPISRISAGPSHKTRVLARNGGSSSR